MAHPLQRYDDPSDASNPIPMFSKNGTALSEAERLRIAQKRGVCLRCGIKTKDTGVFKQKSVTSEQVYKGICIRCNPDKVPQEVYSQWETKFRPAATKTSPAGKFRAAARATALMMHHPEHAQTTDGHPAPIIGGGTRQVDNLRASITALGGRGQQPVQGMTRPVDAFHSSMPSVGGRSNLDGATNMPALHSSAPARQFDHDIGSFRYSQVERSRRQFDGNMSMNALLMSERSQRPLEGSKSFATVREGMGASGGQFDAHASIPSIRSGITVIERSGSAPIEEEDEGQLSLSMPTHESSLRFKYSSSPKKSSSLGLQHKDSGGDGGSSSWLNYDHEASSSRSLVASDYSGGDSTEDIARLMESIKENRKQPEVLQQKLHRLRNLAACEADTMPVIADLLNEYRSDPEVLTAAVGAVWSLIAENDEKKSEATDCGVIDCILDSLRNSQTQEDAEFDEWAIGMLSCLARRNGNREKIGQADGVETILDTLRLQQASAGVFEWSCRALYALVHRFEDEGDSDDAIQQSIVCVDRKDGISVIISTMNIHYTESVAQGWALMLLLRLLDQEDGVAVNRLLNQMNEAGGIAACVKVLKARSTSAQVLSLTAELLANLVVEAAGAENSGALQNAVECIPSVVRVMKEHDCYQNVQESCCRLFAKLCMIDKGRQQIKESKALVDIVYAMMKYTGNLSLQEAGSWTLWTMSSFPSVFTLSYAKDAFSALHTSTKEFSNEPLLLAAACGFVANVSSAAEANASLIPVELPIRALKASNPTDMVDEQACRAVTSICIRNPSKISVVFEGGGVDSLVKRLRSQSLKASAAACRSLAAMANTNDEIRRSVIDAGALDAVLTLLGNLRSTSTLDDAFELIAVLLAWEKKRQTVKLPNDTVSVILEKIESNCDTPDLLTKACDAILNVLLATGTCSKSLELEGLIDAMTKLLDDPGNPMKVKQNACSVLWALVAKQKIKKETEVTAMFRSVVAVMKSYKGEDQAFNSDLQSAAAGALACISARINDALFPVTTEDVDGIIAAIYTAMEYDRQRTELLEKLLNTLLNLSMVNESLIIQCGGIVVVIDAMVDHEQDESILEVGCAILGLLSSTEGLQVNLCIAETDGIDMIISALASFPSNERIQVAACKALSHLSLDNESRQMIVSQGGLMLVVNAMESNNENVGLLECASLALLNLSSDIDAQVLRETNVIETAIEMMRNNPDLANLHKNGLGILQNVSMRGTEGKREIARLGGIKVLVEAIESFMGEAEVLERAFTTMWSLALLESNQKAIAKAGGVELVVNGMMAQLDSAGAQKQACGCLCTLSTNSQNNSAIRDVDGVDAIVYAMWAHFDSEAVLSEACRALSSVAVDMHTSEVIIAQEGEVSAVISAMRCYPTSAKLQENACVALRNLLLSPESVDSIRFLADDIKSVVSSAANRFPEGCGDFASQVLARLS